MNALQLKAERREFRDLLSVSQPTDMQIDRMHELRERHGAALDRFIKAAYDARVNAPGFGAPNCSCHNAPPCQSCVDFTNDLNLPS